MNDQPETSKRARMTPAERGEILAANYGLVLDALENFACRVPSRTPEVRALFNALRELHNHDDEDEHCTEDCPVWFPGAYCSSCGVRHRARSAVVS
jgi:hypothetical protein